ncbi:hypothetical protein BVY01_00230, partial [bacterium I07]
IRLDAGQGSVVSNVLFWNTSANTRLADAVVTDTLNADPLFADPVNGDFTLGDGSPALGAGNDGEALGDLRWAVQPPEPIIVEPGDGTLGAAIAAAPNGAVLMLRGGEEYTSTTDTSYFIDKRLSIVAEPGAMRRPLITLKSIPAGSEVPTKTFWFNDGASLILRGLHFDGLLGSDLFTGSDDFIQLDPAGATVGLIEIRDCLLENYEDQLVEGNQPDPPTVDSVLVINSMFFTTSGLGFRRSDLGYLLMENSTFWNLDNRAFRIQAGSNPEVMINHCTFYNIDHRGLEIRDVGSNVVVKNCIFSKVSRDVIQIDGPTGVISNCLFHESAPVNLHANVVVTDTMWADPMFVNPDMRDLRLAPNSPAIGAADDGTALGDPRWARYLLRLTPVAPGDGTLKAAIAAAAPGDILVLEDGGEYTESADSVWFVDKPLTIRAVMGAETRPVLKNISQQPYDPAAGRNPKFFMLGDGSSLKLMGLELDGGEPDVLAPDPVPTFQSVDDVFMLDLKDSVEVAFLKVYDCLIQNTSDNVLEVWDPNLYGALTGLVLDSIVVKDCLFYNTWRWGVRHVQNSYFELENCTFWDFPDFVVYARDAGTEMVIDHCTFNNTGTEILWNAGSPDEILRFRGDTFTSISITNSIMANGSSDAPIRLDAGQGSVVSNVLFWNTSANTRLADAVVTDTLNADPLFAD